MADEEPPSPVATPETQAERWLSRAMIALMVIMPLAAASVVAVDLGRIVGMTAPLWVAVIAGIAGFVATAVCLAMGLRDQTDFIVVSVLVIVFASILFPLFSAARHKALQASARHYHVR